MVKLNNNKKGVELALNTIVIAILIIIVLLVIVLIFTSKIGQTNDALNQNSGTSCSLSNPAIQALEYKDVGWQNKDNACSGPNTIKISVIPERDNNGIKEVCCGQK